MIARNIQLPEIKLNAPKGKALSTSNTPANTFLNSLSRVLSQRNWTIEWMYTVQKTLGFSRSSLFLGIALLDKLIARGLPLSDANAELIVGALVLIITKFNEIYPVSVRKLNAVSSQMYTREKYVEVEAALLETVGYDIAP
jgi:hypothetical protein